MSASQAWPGVKDCGSLALLGSRPGIWDQRLLQYHLLGLSAWHAKGKRDGDIVQAPRRARANPEELALTKINR